MKTPSLGLAAAALLVSPAQAQPRDSVHTQSVFPPDAQIFGDSRVEIQQQLMVWTVTEARCEGQGVAAIAAGRPFISYGYWREGASREQRFRFRIDATGRPLTIALDGPLAGNAEMADEMGAALAVARFAAAPARADCRIAFLARRTPVETAAPGDLMQYSMAPVWGARLPPVAWKHMASAGSTCMDVPRPAVRLRAFPDFDALPSTPGVRDWSMVGYDLDARGRPVKLRIVEGTGNRALDAASIAAVRASRFADGARTGCLYPYWRKAAPLPAPPSPDKAGFRPEGSSCADDRPWAVKPQMTYPPAYQRRAIEGWAAIAYDVAPWGDIGNVRVLASEPAAAFGQQAIRIVRSARKAPSPEGAAGCVEMVRFVTARDDAAADGESAGFGQY